MKIGIIGAENSHATAYSKALNINNAVKGFRVEYIWGETREFAEKAAANGKIPNVVDDWREMLGKIDALIVDHRHAKYHLKAALPFVKSGVPVFIDKPLCYRASEGREFLKIARACGTPVTSFSLVPQQASYRRFLKRIGACKTIVTGATFGPCDTKSPYGGVFFYGVHQVEAALHAFGFDVSSVFASRRADNVVVDLFYPAKIVTLNFVQPAYGEFAILADTEQGIIFEPLKFDVDHYIKSVKRFCRMFKTRQELLSHDVLLKPVQVLEAIEKSLKSKSIEQVDA